MQASKENARKAAKHLSTVVKRLGLELNTELLFIRDFIAGAEKKLPSEAAYEKDRQRKKAAAK